MAALGGEGILVDFKGNDRPTSRRIQSNPIQNFLNHFIVFFFNDHLKNILIKLTSSKPPKQHATFPILTITRSGLRIRL